MATNRRLVVPQCISHVTRKTTSLLPSCGRCRRARARLGPLAAGGRGGAAAAPRARVRVRRRRHSFPPPAGAYTNTYASYPVFAPLSRLFAMLSVLTLASLLAGAAAVPHANAEKVKVAFYGGACASSAAFELADRERWTWACVRWH